MSFLLRLNAQFAIVWWSHFTALRHPRNAFVAGRKDLQHQVRKPRPHRISLGTLPPSKKQQGAVRGRPIGAIRAVACQSSESGGWRTKANLACGYRWKRLFPGCRCWIDDFQPALAMEITWSRSSLNRPVGIFDLPRPIVLGVVAFIIRVRFASIRVHDVSLLKAGAI